jgi:hypothetical protein
MNPLSRGFLRPWMNDETERLSLPLVIDGGWGAGRPAFSRHRSPPRVFSQRRRLSMDGLGRARTIKADPGAGVAGDLRGRAVFRSDH